MDVLLLTVFAITFVMLLKLSGKGRQERLLDALPGPRGLPVIGNFFDVLQTRQNYLKLSAENEAKFGGIYKTWIGSTPIVHISKPQYAEVILNTKGITRHPNQSSLITKSLKAHPFGWLSNKNVVASTLHSMQPQSVVDITNSNCEVLLSVLRGRGGESVSVDWESISFCVIDCICEIILGVKIGAQMGQNPSFATSLLTLNKLSEKNQKVRFYSDSLFRMTSFGKDYNKHLNVVQDVLRKIIQNRRDTRDTTNICNKHKKGKDESVNESNVLDDLLLYNGINTTAQIENEIVTVLCTALDSIDRMVYWVVYALGHHLSVQHQVQREIKTVCGKRANDCLTIKDLQKMTYLDRVIKETLRLYPPHPFIIRELEKDTKIGNYLIPYGTTICIQVANLHRDPDSFPNGNQFDPDNFHSRKTAKRTKFTFIPFGATEGICIGQKVTEIIQRTILTNLVRAFEIEGSDKFNRDSGSVSNNIQQDRSGVVFRLNRRKEVTKLTDSN